MIPRSRQPDPGKPRFALGVGEPEEERIRALLVEHFDLQMADGPGCALRVIGPREIEIDGPRALRRHRLRAPDVPALVLMPPGATLALARDCFREGAADVLNHEEVDAGLGEAALRLVERSAYRSERQTEAQLMAASLGESARELGAALCALRDAYDQTLIGLVSALDYRERESGYHSHRVAIYAVFLGLRVGLDEATLESLFRGALLHDIGKVGTPDTVLLKHGDLSDEDWEIIRQHPDMGAAIVSGIPFLRASSEIPLAHHEAWDGRGYPRGLKEHEIPAGARIFAVVDSYDAIRSKRAYKEAQTHGEAIAGLRAVAGRRLDPALVDTFCAERESTWTGLEKAVGESLTFGAVLAVCRETANRGA